MGSLRKKQVGIGFEQKTCLEMIFCGKKVFDF